MNLSRGGIFIRADITPQVGTEIDFSFTVPGSGRVIQATGIVVWRRGGGRQAKDKLFDHPAGMGVQFREISVQDLDFLFDHLESLMKTA